jgi:hypothetical protein
LISGFLANTLPSFGLLPPISTTETFGDKLIAQFRLSGVNAMITIFGELGQRSAKKCGE